MNTEEIKALYRQVCAARVALAEQVPLSDDAKQAVSAAMTLETCLIVLLATAPRYNPFKGAI